MISLDFAIAGVQTEDGKVGLLTEIVAFFFVICFAAVRENGDGLTFFDNVPSQITVLYRAVAVNVVDADGLNITFCIQIRFVNVLDGSIIGIPVFINANNPDRPAGTVVFDPNWLEYAIPGQLPDLILNNLLRYFQDSGIKEILNVAKLNDPVKIVQITREFQANERLKLLGGPNLIAPDERFGINSLKRCRENDTFKL